MAIFGVLNVTPDSFSDGGKFIDPEIALLAAQALFDDGADYVDVGAEATNPFTKPITAEEEQARLKLILPALLERHPGKISLDTYHLETARWALDHGEFVLNDMSGLFNEHMVKLALKNKLACIVGHIPPEAKGIPLDAHKFATNDYDEVIQRILKNASRLSMLGLAVNDMILDPGIGFGKTMRLNWRLLECASDLPGYNVLIGHSKKRFLGTNSITGEPLPNGDEIRFSDEANLQAAKLALNAGATHLRVHNPKIYQHLK